MECPICYDLVESVFTNSCNHSWCKACHHKLIKFKHTECCMCRGAIILPYKSKMKPNAYIEWLLNGGQPRLRWRPKRYRKGQFYRYKY